MSYSDCDNFSGLVGRTVSGVLVNDDQSVIVFETDEGNLTFETRGDCCSETWWADLVGFDALIGNRIVSAESIDLPEPQDNRTRQEYDSAYGLKITTGAGICDIAYRNSSNGYYGGHAVPSRETYDLDTFQRITGDWSA